MSEFKFKKFLIKQYLNAMKVTTDACILGAMSDFEGKNNLLDIGAGTGLLSLMCAQKYNKLQISSVEIDSVSFLELKENIENSPWKNRIHFFCADIKDWADDSKNLHAFDAIIANPPYFHQSLLSNNARRGSARHSDFSLSLNDFLCAVIKLLAKNGVCYFLYPAARKGEIELCLQQKDLYLQSVVELKNTNNAQPKAAIYCVSFVNNDKPIFSSFIIKNDGGKEYSDAVQKLLKDFYLFL
jgi:tRNA1Val (adenine37-N6)-methyltransferase